MLRVSGCARGSKPTGDKLTKPAFHGCLRSWLDVPHEMLVSVDEQLAAAEVHQGYIQYLDGKFNLLPLVISVAGSAVLFPDLQ